jgi:hypothetical protein
LPLRDGLDILEQRLVGGLFAQLERTLSFNELLRRLALPLGLSKGNDQSLIVMGGKALLLIVQVPTPEGIVEGRVLPFVLWAHILIGDRAFLILQGIS